MLGESLFSESSLWNLFPATVPDTGHLSWQFPLSKREGMHPEIAITSLYIYFSSNCKSNSKSALRKTKERLSYFLFLHCQYTYHIYHSIYLHWKKKLFNMWVAKSDSFCSFDYWIVWCGLTLYSRVFREKLLSGKCLL